MAEKARARGKMRNGYAKQPHQIYTTSSQARAALRLACIVSAHLAAFRCTSTCLLWSPAADLTYGFIDP